MEKLFSKRSLGIFAVLFLFAVSLLLVNKVNSYKAELANIEQMYKQETEKVSKITSKLDEAGVKVVNLEFEKAYLIQNLESSNELTNKLKALVTSYKKEIDRGTGNALVFKTQTKVDTVFINNSSTLGANSTQCTLSDNYIDMQTIITGDTCYMDLQLNANYSIVVGEEKANIFSKPKPFALISTDNPYVNIKEAKSFSVKVPKQKRNSVSISTGYGVAFVDNSIKLSPFVGAGYSRSLFSF